MKKIQAIIRTEKLEPLKEALTNGVVHGMTVRQVQGFGNSLGWSEYYRGSEVIINLVPKIEVEMVVADNEVPEIVEKIMAAAWTGEVGDGKVFVMPVEECVRIRTGDTGEKAL